MPPPSASSAAAWPADQAAGVSVVIVLLVLWAGASAVHLVPASERGVVLRLGRPVRCSGSGLRLTLPLLERMVVVPAGESFLDPVNARATNRDQAHVSVWACGRFRVRDPLRWCERPDGYARTLNALEAAMREDVGMTALDDLVGYPAGREGQLQDATNRVVEAWGVEVTGLEPVAVEVAVDQRLLQWAQRLRCESELVRPSSQAEADEQACTSPKR